MIEDGMRLQISIQGKDFTIIDQLTDGVIMWQGDYVTDTLDHVAVISNLQNLVSQLAQCKQRVMRGIHRTTTTNGISIVETMHCKVDFDTRDGVATLDERTLYRSAGFDVMGVINALSSTVETLGRHASKVLNPRTSAVRFIPDLNLIVLKGSGNTVVVNRDNVHGNVLSNVLYNRLTLPFVYVDVHSDEGMVYLFNGELKDISSIPYDKSFDVYFVSDDKSFDTEGEEYV